MINKLKNRNIISSDVSTEVIIAINLSCALIPHTHTNSENKIQWMPMWQHFTAEDSRVSEHETESE